MSVSRERHWFERTANDIAKQRGFQLLAGAEVVRPKHLLDSAVEAFDHAVGLGVFGRAEPLRQHRRGRITGLDRRPHLQRRRHPLTKMNKNARTPSRVSLKIHFAMKNAKRRGSL